MASYFDKSKVSIASSSVHNFPLHPMHLTTSNFMQFDIAFAKEFPKTKTCKINHQSFVRLMPMKRPLMSSVQFHKSSYFVPFRTVWPAFTDFLEDSPHVQQEGATILSNVPLISNYKLISWFVANGLVDVTSQVSSLSANNEYDVVTPDMNSQSQTYLQDRLYKFNSFGRHCFKLLTSLGIRPKWRKYSDNPSDDETFSALPLLCAARVYLDYFFPNQYAKSGYYINLEGMFQRHYIYTLSDQDLTSIFNVCYLVSYNSDYFVSAFDSAMGPSEGLVSDTFRISDLSLMNQDPDNDYSSFLSVTNEEVGGTPTLNQLRPTQNIVLTQNMDNQLKALTNYIRRHSLSGSRALERYLADWGVALSADKLQRCYKLTEKHYPLQVSDVTSTADTINGNDGAALGDYAGRGIAYNQDCNFEFETDEFGYLIIVNTIIPDVSYAQGLDYNVLHKTKLDFLNGDFDGLVNRPLLSEELFVGMKRNTDNKSEIFGFIPSYAEYKTAPDIIDGDFLLDTKNLGLIGFSTERHFSDKFTDDEFDVVHNLNFVLGNDFDQFNRIFLDSEDDSDKFIVIHRCNMDNNLPAVPLYDYYDFADNKKKILMEVNGSKSN